MSSQHPTHPMHPEPHDGSRSVDGATVVRPRPLRVSAAWILVALGAFLLVMALYPDLVGLFLDLFVVLIVVAGCLMTVARLSLVRRAIRRMRPTTARIRRNRRPTVPDRVEVRAERITAAGPDGEELGALDRADGDLLTVRELNGVPYLYVAGPSDGNVSIDLRRFDAEEVGRAALAHGWRWWRSLGPADPAVDEPADAQTVGCEILLRNGKLRQPPIKQTVIATAAAASTVVVAAVIVGERVGLATWQWYGAGAAFVLLAAGGIVGALLVLMRLSRLEVAVDPRRISVTRGTFPVTVAQRTSVTSGRAGRRWVRLRDERGKAVHWVPLRPKRDEVLTAMRTYGWPATDEAG